MLGIASLLYFIHFLRMTEKNEFEGILTQNREFFFEERFVHRISVLFSKLKNRIKSCHSRPSLELTRFPFLPLHAFYSKISKRQFSTLRSWIISFIL